MVAVAPRRPRPEARGLALSLLLQSPFDRWHEDSHHNRGSIILLVRKKVAPLTRADKGHRALLIRAELALGAREVQVKGVMALSHERLGPLQILVRAAPQALPLHLHLLLLRAIQPTGLHPLLLLHLPIPAFRMTGGVCGGRVFRYPK